jgi:hypothetical protein
MMAVAGVCCVSSVARGSTAAEQTGRDAGSGQGAAAVSATVIMGTGDVTGVGTGAVLGTLL